MMLTISKIKSVKPQEKIIRLSDGRGLYLQIMPSGSKYWRYNYKINGKQKTYPYGVYSDVSLSEVRELHSAVRKKVLQGIDPMHEKKITKIINKSSQSNAFEFIAREFVENKKVSRWGESSAQRIEGRLKNYVYPYIGSLPIDKISPPELLVLLKNIESKRYYETAHRVRSIISQIFKYGIATQRCFDDPAANLTHALVPYKSKEFAAILEPKEIGILLNSIDNYKGSQITIHAMKLAPLTLVRPTELRHAEKTEFNLKDALWTIPGCKMKMNKDHLIPLSHQAVSIVKSALNWSGKSKYLFPATTTSLRPMSENTVNNAIRRLGYNSEEMTGHGFRAMGSTLLNEQGYNPDWIEVQLAHKDRNRIRGVYNRAKHLKDRRGMLQEWADYLDLLRNS